MGVIRYQSNDVGAPILQTQNCMAAYQILKACLQDGYGSKAAAGWTMAIEDVTDPDNVRFILRNDSVTGTGRLFRFTHDTSNGTSGTTSRQYMQFHGCESYTDVDSTLGNFPNLPGDANADTTTYNNGFNCKIANSNNNAGPFPWIVIADERTCYLSFVDSASAAGKTNPFDVAILETTARDAFMFGDIEVLNGATDPYASIVIGGEYSSSGDGQLSDATDGTINTHYINRHYDGSPGAVEIGVVPALQAPSTNYVGAQNSATATHYYPYPHPVSGGEVFSQLLVHQNDNAVESAVQVNRSHGTTRGHLRGMYGCQHTFHSGAADRIGSIGDVIAINGRNYLLLPVMSDNIQVCAAFDITGPWA